MPSLKHHVDFFDVKNLMYIPCIEINNIGNGSALDISIEKIHSNLFDTDLKIGSINILERGQEDFIETSYSNRDSELRNNTILQNNKRSDLRNSVEITFSFTDIEGNHYEQNNRFKNGKPFIGQVELQTKKC